jgi:hypothetical protein
VNLGLELNFNVQIQVEPQAQLLVFAIVIILAAEDTSHSLACRVADSIDGLAGGVLNKVSSTADGIANISDTAERATFLLLLRLAATAAGALTSSGIHIAAVDLLSVFWVVIALLSARTGSSVPSTWFRLRLRLRLRLRFFFSFLVVRLLLYGLRFLVFFFFMTVRLLVFGFFFGRLLRWFFLGLLLAQLGGLLLLRGG